jgi:hypothetical protein
MLETAMFHIIRGTTQIDLSSTFACTSATIRFSCGLYNSYTPD